MTKNALIMAVATTAALATASTSHAQGISFDGAYIEGVYISNYFSGSYGYDQSAVYGAAQVSFGKVAVQVDVGVFGYDAEPWDNTYYAVHAMYRFSPKFVVGAYFGQDLFNGGGGSNNWSTYGIEAKFNPNFAGGRFTFEALIGALDNITFVPNTMIGLGVEYAVTDRIDLGLSYLRGAWSDLNDPNDRYDVLELEATYTFGSGLYATASYTDTIFVGSDWTEATFGIAVGFNFGGGTTFDRRGYSTLYPGD